MTAPEVERCRHEWQPFYDAPELDGCVYCGAEQAAGPLRTADHPRVA